MAPIRDVSNHPKNFYKAGKLLVKMGFDGVDINMGCPVKAVIKKGAGSALINNKPLAIDIIKATKKGTLTITLISHYSML